MITSRREQKNNKAKVFQHPIDSHSQSASSCFISPHFAAGAVGVGRGAASFLATESTGTVLIPRLMTRIAGHGFQEEVATLKSGKRNQRINQLDLFQSENGVLCCGGRLANAGISQSSRFPTLLPRGHIFTKMVIISEHEKVFHSGTKATLARVRLNYWIPHGLTEVKRAIKPCLICQRLQSGTFKPPRMAQLPAERVQQSAAFTYTGLDYMGPLMIRDNRAEGHQKRWVAIFSCFSTRAIHLEMVNDCTAEAAVNAIMRFIGRRGTPHTILSDNAQQFKKGARILEAIWGDTPNKEITEVLTGFYAENGIQWRNIPEKSPWVGGFYERLVGLVKQALRKTLWKATINGDKLGTLLVQIEGVLNMRPLLVQGSEADEFATLCPANFISPSSRLGAPPSLYDNDDPDYSPPKSQDLMAAWATIQKRLDQFWKAWSMQYLQELRERHQVHFKRARGEVRRSPKVGEVCLIRDATPRATWKLGKIVKLIPSTDEETRFVEVKFPSKFVTRRGVRDLVPLELDFTENC